MPRTLGTRSTLTAVNVDPGDFLTVAAVISVIASQAARTDRDDLRDCVEFLMYQPGEGLDVVTRTAAQREHLANAFGFDPELHVDRRSAGVSYAGRRGTLLEVPVTIWYLDAIGGE